MDKVIDLTPYRIKVQFGEALRRPEADEYLRGFGFEMPEYKLGAEFKAKLDGFAVWYTHSGWSSAWLSPDTNRYIAHARYGFGLEHLEEALNTVYAQNQPTAPSIPGILSSIYDSMVELGVEIDNHHTDLYVPVTPQTEDVVARYKWIKQVKRFRPSDGTKGEWFEIPFAYTPAWQERGL
jgi:hypothetical protein